MPTESISDLALIRRTHRRRALRLGIGVILSFLIALAFDWTLAYLAPVLQKTAAPSLRVALEVLFVTIVLMLMLACLVVGGVSQAYPALFLLALFPVLFWIYRYGLRGGSAVGSVVASSRPDAPADGREHHQ